MYQCCEEIQQCMKELRLEIVNVKDSVSMAVCMGEQTVKVTSSPLSQL